MGQKFNRILYIVNYLLPIVFYLINRKLFTCFKKLSNSSHNLNDIYIAYFQEIIYVYLIFLKPIFKRLQNGSKLFIFPLKNGYIDYCKQFRLHVITKKYV